VITRLIVANRGEIARRVFATCRRLGIETVAVHSDADAALPFVAEADQAVRLPGNAPADTYLRIDLVIDAALKSGADAIHPGYGFLSENADFARAVIAAGLTWVGPPPDAIAAMGDKVRAKEIAAKAGVPVLSAPDSPTEADLPLLVKASAGGGGRGMRVVRTLDRLDDEIEAASAEARSAFGDGTVFVEPYVEAGRHIEVQVVGHADGARVLGHRDCSVQRRHQKVVEEAPAPGLPSSTWDAMSEAADQLCLAIGYVGAGTVEFLYDPAADRFFFLEMNTRLQVEHPVTELTRGVDLVELQIAVAEGRELPDSVPVSAGHAIEVRLYAEDAAYVPQSGRLVTFDLPSDAEFGPLSASGVRVDSGFVSGDEVSTFYDAMLAKMVAWAPTREQSIRMLVAALRRARIHGVTTNRDHLVDILTDPVFVAGEMTTTWLESRPSGEPATESDVENIAQPPLEAVAGALMLAAADAERRTVQQGIPAAWRNVVSQPQRTTFEGHASVEWWGSRDGFVVDGVTVLEVSPTHARLEAEGVTTRRNGLIVADRHRGTRAVYVDGGVRSVGLREVPRFTDPAETVASGSLLAPMPGTVVRVAVEAGATVTAGDVVLVLEAMKMQHTVTAPHDGTVTEINVEPGAQVAAGEVLAVVEEN